MPRKQSIKKESSKSPTAITKDAIINMDDCKATISLVNNELEKRAAAKFNTLNPCDSAQKGCGCGENTGGNEPGQKTDLIVLIDTSGSMKPSATAIDKAVTKAITKAKKECKPDLRIVFLGVDGTWTGTSFAQSHRAYITGLHGTVPLEGDTNHVGLKSEQGANAIEDLSKYFDWREGACRAIFYISDEELDSISPRNDFANETGVVNAAVAEANLNKVSVFAHHLTYQNLDPQIIQNYTDLCQNTGGRVYFSNAPSEKEYVDLLTEVICNSCGVSTCKSIELPEIKPCITIKWGDSACDCLESSDIEVMTITVCNCFTNVQFENFIISKIEVLNASGGAVPLLPNGSPSVKLHPIGIHCFGDIAPCSCISREFVLITEGAKEGKYQLNVQGVCFDISIPHKFESECFEFEVCRD